MIKTRLRVTSGLLWVAFTLLSFYPAHPATAETYTADAQNRDFYFLASEPSVITIRTYAQQYGIDSMLWVYDGETLVTANDDYYGLDSRVEFVMSPNVQYRLRAGVCCGNPETWYGSSYVIEPSLAPVAPETTTTEPLPTSTVETTTTTSTTTTTIEPDPTTTTQVTPSETYVVPTTVLETTTSAPVSTTSLPAQTTTTTAPAPVVESTTTTSSSSTTSTSLVVPTTTTTTTSLPPPTTLPVTTSSSLPPVSPTMPPSAALAIAVSAEALKTITPDEASQVFESLEVSQLSEEQAEELVTAVQEAPESVRAAFEDKVNVFDSKFNSYVPLGSTINVGQRKVLIAATGVLFMAPTVPTTSGSAPSNPRRK